VNASVRTTKVLSENPTELPILRISCQNSPMRKLTILLALVFSVMFSSTSFAEWKKVGENVDGDTFYVDFDRIRKHGGYVYFWSLGDLLKPFESGTLSVKKPIFWDHLTLPFLNVPTNLSPFAKVTVPCPCFLPSLYSPTYLFPLVW